jgi:hypothetical protein
MWSHAMRHSARPLPSAMPHSARPITLKLVYEETKNEVRKTGCQKIRQGFWAKHWYLSWLCCIFPGLFIPGLVVPGLVVPALVLLVSVGVP